MTLIRSNATLLAVKGGGLSEDYDLDEGDDNNKWTGSEPCLADDEVEFERSGGVSGALRSTGANLRSTGANVITRTVMRIPSGLEVLIIPNDTVVYEQYGVTHTRKVELVVDQRLVGMVFLQLAVA